MLQTLLSETKQPFVWLPELDAGYIETPSNYDVYDGAYYNKYVQYANTDVGRRLNKFRVELVKKYIGDEPVIDIGIGSGSFIEARGSQTYGYDINPVAVEWLKGRGLFRNPQDGTIYNKCFWDSLEHIPDPRPIILGSRFIFVTMPIYSSAYCALNSKHFKPGEHVWYFTKNGLIGWLNRLGFDCLEIRDDEEKIGRQGVLTFVFKSKDLVNKNG